MKKLRAAIGAIIPALICAALLCGCGVSRESLAGLGIYAQDYSDGALNAAIERALLSGKDSFDAVYLGKISAIRNISDNGWNKGYICGRYVERIDAEYEQCRGYVNAHYRVTAADAQRLESMPREGDGLKIYPTGAEAVDECLMSMIWGKTDSAVFLFESAESLNAFDGAFKAAVEQVRKTNYACEYAVDEIRWVITGYGDVTEVEFALKYAKGRPPLDKLALAHTRTELFDALTAAWSGDFEAVAAVLTQDMDISEAETVGIIEAACANCADMPCESLNIWRVRYAKQDGKQIIAAWLKMPAETDTLLAMRQELRRSISARAEKILARHSEPEKLYRAAYREVISAAKYDDALAGATRNDALTDEMRIRRTAYGALVDGRTVCTGYAMAYKALCGYMGLECYVVLGTQEGGDHAWNAVRLGGEWRYVDCTYGDTGGGSKYCLFGRDSLRKLNYEADRAFEVENWR